MNPLVSIALFLILLLGGFGIGSLLTRRVQSDFLSRLEHLIFAIPLGMGVLGYVALVLGLLRQANLLALGVPTGIAALLGLICLRNITRHALPKVASVLLIPLILLGICTFIGALAPPGGLEWDSLSYHLAGPKRYLLEGRVYYIPDDHHTNFPFTWQMLYMTMLSFGSIAGAKLCHWVCLVFLCLSMMTFAHRHFPEKKHLGGIAALVLASTPILFWEATTAYIDLATTLFVWLSLYALTNATTHIAEKVSVPWLVVSALCMGIALGTKSTVLVFWGMCLIGILLWHLIVHKRWAKESLPHAVLWGAIALAIGLPWYVKSFLYTGDPVHPFAFNIFHGHYWNAQAATEYATEQAKFGMGKNPLSALLAPWRVTNELLYAPEHKQATGRPFIFTEYKIFGLSPVYLALVFALPLVASLKKLPQIIITFLLFGLGVGATWFFQMQQTRYLLPALPGLAIVVAWVICEAEKLVRWAGYALLSLISLWTLYIGGVGISLNATYAFEQPIKQYISNDLSIGNLAKCCFWINENTPKNAKVAAFDDTEFFYLDRPYVWAQPNHAPGLIPWDDYKDVDDWLADFKRRGYTTLLQGNKRGEDQRWRGLLDEAMTTGKVTLAHEEYSTDQEGKTYQRVRVYQIQ
jgi:4-amino-4-deoxy-L-arabinose transferase-like glycosyltransferase